MERLDTQPEIFVQYVDGDDNDCTVHYRKSWTANQVEPCLELDAMISMIEEKFGRHFKGIILREH